MKPSTTLPPASAYTAGMPCTRKAWETCGFSSTLTLASTTLPPVSSTTFSMMGPSVRHGPHHGAHRSTTTGSRLGAVEDLGLERRIGDVDGHAGQGTGLAARSDRRRHGDRRPATVTAVATGPSRHPFKLFAGWGSLYGERPMSTAAQTDAASRAPEGIDVGTG